MQECPRGRWIPGRPLGNIERNAQGANGYRDAHGADGYWMLQEQMDAGQLSWLHRTHETQALLPGTCVTFPL